MKTIANIMIINSQNVKPKHLAISSHHNISSSFKEENFASAWTSSREVANIGLPKLLLDELKYLTCVHAATIYTVTELQLQRNAQ